VSISVGRQLGAYEITALIGEGGMGRVFRARDTRLKRDVAIKALAIDVALDADRTARFRREAEALAALSHPRIAGIHDIFESDGSQYLVLELVDGETLADHIARGPLPPADAFRIAIEIAEALEVAHERGIIHRDLKPANVKITPDGRVKVLDFGLAKDLSGDAAHAGPSSLTHSPTIVGATRAGVILGTAAYMSPEQARGQRVDARADVWAWGCVLYEMLTGRQPFLGGTVTDLLASIVRGEPDWAGLPADTPSGVRSLLRRCLRKELSQRLHHIADARIALEDGQADQSALSTGAEATKTRATARWAWGAVALLAASVVALSAALVLGRRSAVPPSEMRLEITTPETPNPVQFAIAPDGVKLAFVGSADGAPRLWMRTLDSTTARPLAGTERATFPFWSPDSRSIGFFADGKLKRIDIVGASVQTVASAPIGSGGAWSAAGVIVFAPSPVGDLFQVAATGGEPRLVLRRRLGQQSLRFPVFLPNGRDFLVFVGATRDTTGVYLGSLDATEAHQLFSSDSAAVLTSTGHVLYVRQGTLFAQPFDIAHRQLSGDAIALTDRVTFDGTISLAALTASAAGPFAYRTGDTSGLRQLVWFDRKGAKLGVIGASDGAGLFNPELSPDGRLVAINRTVDTNTDIWQMEVARGVLRRFSFDAATDQLPVWSPDGKHIIFSSNRSNMYDLFRKPSNGPGSEEVLLASSENKFAMGVSLDGRYLLYRNTAPNSNWDLWALALDGDGKPGTPFPVVQTPFQEMMGELSPDSTWVAFQSDESGQFEIYAQSFPQPGPRTQISTNGGSQPRWRRDGKELFYVSLDGRMMAATIAVNQRKEVEAGDQLALFPARIAGGPVPTPQKHQYAVSADGQRFLLNTMTDESATSPITLVMNWKPPSR
jgi:Tol biopolymer transport system component